MSVPIRPNPGPATAFIDCDGVVFHEGTNDFLPGAVENLKAIQERGDHIVFFTCRPPGLAREWIEKLRDAGIDVGKCGYLHKPMADSYYYVDDKLDLARCGVLL